MNYEELTAHQDAHPGNFRYGKGSLAHLAGVHPDLQRVFLRLMQITTIDVAVVDGLRTVAEQRRNVANGASKTMRSRHLTGHAIDVAPYVSGKMSWHWPHYRILREFILKAASAEGVTLRSGSNWDEDDNWEERGEDDGPHWELPRRLYPS